MAASHTVCCTRDNLERLVVWVIEFRTLYIKWRIEEVWGHFEVKQIPKVI